MTTVFQTNGDHKVRLVRDVVKILRERNNSKAGLEASWWLVKIAQKGKLWKILESFGITAPQRRAALNKIAFPDHNREEVDAALRAGNNYLDIYALARGRASIDKDAKNKYKRNKNGAYLIVKNSN